MIFSGRRTPAHRNSRERMKNADTEKSRVRLKGVGNSLCLMLDPLAPLEELQAEIDKLFSDLKLPTKDARVTIDVGTGKGHENLVETLSDFLTDRFGVGSVSRSARKKTTGKRSPASEGWVRKRDIAHSWQNHRSDVLMLAGRVRSGQKVTARNHLIILGDVNPGAEVIAGGDIMVMGSLLGTAIAGQPDSEESIVLALDFRPTQIQIGHYVAAGLPSSPGRVAEFAHVENQGIMVESYLDANPFSRLPWPQAR